MNEIFITELDQRKGGLWVNYTDLKSRHVPRVGEYIRLYQRDIPNDWFIVRYVSYENFSYVPDGEYRPRAHIYVERVNGNPSFYRGSETSVRDE